MSCVVCGGTVLSAGLGDELRVCPTCGKHIARRRTSPEAEQLMKDAFSERKNGDRAKAVRLYQSALALFPDNADAHFGIALCRHGIEFGRTDGKTTVGLLTYSPYSFLTDLSYLRACSLASDAGSENFALFASAVQKEKNAYLKTEKMKPCDVIVCCADGVSPDGTADVAFKEASAISDRLAKQGIKSVVLTKAPSELDRRARAEFFNAVRSSRVLLCVLSDKTDTEREPMKTLVSTFSKDVKNGAPRFVTTVMSRDYIPKITKSERKSGLKIMLSPEDRTELALETEEKLRSAGRFLAAVPPDRIKSKHADGIRRGYAKLADGDFDGAEDIFNSVLLSEQTDAAALWGLFLSINRAKNAEETLLHAESVSGREVLGRLLRYGTEGTVAWVKKYIKVLSFNIHVKFLAAFFRKDRKQAEKYAEQYRLFESESVINDAHRVMTDTLGGSSESLLPGAVLACISYYKQLPFSAGEKNMSALASLYDEIRKRQLKGIEHAFVTADKKNGERFVSALLGNIECFCSPAAPFEKYTGTKITELFTSYADTPGSLWFFAAQYLENAAENPNSVQKAVTDACFDRAAAESRDMADFFTAAKTRREEENKKLREENAPKGAQQIIESAASVLAVGGRVEQNGKKGVWQSLWAVILFVLSCVALAGGVMINLRPSALLRFDRRLFVILSTAVCVLFLIFSSVLSFLLFRARKTREHRLSGRAVLHSLPFVTVACSVAALTLSIVSAATFSSRLPQIYLSNVQEFLYLHNYPTGNFVLVNDISLDDVTIIGEFKRFGGTFDGRGHTISGFTSDSFVIKYNNGEIRNIKIEGAKTPGFVRNNHGIIENITIEDTNFSVALIETNYATVKNSTFADCVFGGGAMIYKNKGTISGLTVNGNVLNCALGYVCSLGDSYFISGVLGINEGIFENCNVSNLRVSAEIKKTHVGGVLGINTGSVSSVSADGITVDGIAVSAGLFAARNTGTITDSKVGGKATLEVSRSYGGFVGENTKQITDCSSDVYSEVTLVSDSSTSGKSSSGGFIGSSVGTVSACTAKGKQFFDCKTDADCAVYAGGAIGITEGKVTELSTDVSFFFTSYAASGSTESAIGGAFGCIKNASVSKIARSGRTVAVIKEPSDESETQTASKYQPKYLVGGFAGSIISDSDHKNETVSELSVDGTVRVNAKKRTFVNFGSLIGFTNCDHIITNAIISGAFTVRSDGYDKVSFGVIIGRSDSVESVEGIAFAGTVGETGTETSGISFTGGADGAFQKCYARDNCGTSATGTRYVPVEVFYSESFYTDTLGWNAKNWSFADGLLPILKFTAQNAD